MNQNTKNNDDKSAKAISRAIENPPSSSGIILVVAIFLGLIALMIVLEILRR